MRKIKKYANRKLYDTKEKQYISMDQLSELIKAGEDVSIIDNKTGQDLTSSIVSQLLAKERKRNQNEVSPRLLISLLRRGGGTLVDYAKRYASLWQNALTMAEDEIDKLVNLMIKDKELSESEGSKLKKEIVGYAANLKEWIGDNIDHRISEVLSMMNLATKEQIVGLTKRIEDLNKKVEKIEKLQKR